MKAKPAKAPAKLHAVPKKTTRAEANAKTKASRALPMDSDSAETSYPLNEWMIPATDSHGHSAKVFCRCPPSYKHQIGAILQKRRYPWDTESDLMRVALHRLLNDVAKDSGDPEITSQQAILNSLVETSSRQMEYLHFKETLDKLSTITAELIRADAAPMAKKMVRAVAEQVDNFEEPYWRERFQKEIVDKFGELVGDERPKKKKK